MTGIEDGLARQKVLVVDGAMGTELERRGWDVADPLWSAKILAETPDAVADVHNDYLLAGADILITASYQATFEGFASRGMTREEGAALMCSSVTLARECVAAFWAVPENRENRVKPLVAASVGPYGAFLADGSEFRGNYPLGEAALMDFHRERMKTLVEAGPDLLACETVPCFTEARALVRLLEEFAPITAWVSFSARDGKYTNAGDPVQDCARWLDSKKQVAAVGINCTGPEHIPSLIREIRQVTDKPIIVYPNRGGHWDAGAKTFQKDNYLPSFGQMAKVWADAGATLIGGCCETTPEDIRDLRNRLFCES